MKKPLEIPESTRLRQAQASDPRHSVWVSANAGSGKTHVLAQRVIRLLYEQRCLPGRILCLTFTKAAAANMSERVFRQLAVWSGLDDFALADAIEATGAPRPQQAQELAFARKLFARAVETPGGLKIQTLHAFCEKILHAAPFEANVAAGFSILEEARQNELIARAKIDALAHARRDPALAPALELVAEAAGMGFDDILRDALRQRSFFRTLAAPKAEAVLRAALGLEPGDTAESITRKMLEGGEGPQRWLDYAAVMQGGTRTDIGKAEDLVAAHADWRAGRRDAALERILAFFFTQKGEPRKKLLTGAPAKAHPKISEALAAEQTRLAALSEKRAAAEAADRSLALGKIVGVVLARYERLKAERQWLDFDDLIARTLELLSRSSARWALYKLDAGIDHILVDEAQDVSAAQWEILNRLTDDFFTGEGQARRARTLFVVGDEKQSIFSFQGAAPELFDRTKRDVARRAADSDKPFLPVELNLSFRSAPGVLAAVDKVFSLPEHYRGLSAGDHAPPVHEALKRGAPSRVEIWDVIAPQPRAEKRDWKLPVDFQDAADPPVASARRIAATIAGWLRDGESIGAGAERRRIRPGDIMILVRKRDAFFEAMIRALKEQNVPVAGADRLQLATHIAVMDLVVLGRAALLPDDDLALATALKTPLFGFDDEDLLELAPGRTASLFAAMRASSSAKMQAACALLDLLGKMGRALPPFAFYARLLGPRGGRRAFLARLGPEAGDAMDEFLNLALAHERARAPSLPAFLAEVEALEASIKRDMDSGDAFVRVMTAHAAKGLEGRIVFLPDVCSAPGGQHDSKLFEVSTPGKPVLIWSPRKEADCGAVREAREARKEMAAQEYRRLLYVALTRAEERLYIAGHRGAREVAAESWRMMIETALKPDAHEAPAPWGREENIRRFGPPAPDLPPAPAEGARAAASAAPAAWAFAPAPSEFAAQPPLRPSGALDGADGAAEAAALAPRRALALAEGRLTHRLLQYLPDVAPEARRAAAFRDLAAGGADPGRAGQLIEQALQVIEDPRLAPLFGPASVAEAPIAARLARPDGGGVEISGALDRLAENADSVWLAEYKTGAPSAAHVRQLALYRAAVALLYPGKTLRCFLVYVSGPSVVEVDAERLDQAELSQLSI